MALRGNQVRDAVAVKIAEKEAAFSRAVERLPECLSADADFDRVRKFRFAGLAAILQQDQRLRPEQ